MEKIEPKVFRYIGEFKHFPEEFEGNPIEENMYCFCLGHFYIYTSNKWISLEECTNSVIGINKSIFKRSLMTKFGMASFQLMELIPDDANFDTDSWVNPFWTYCKEICNKLEQSCTNVYDKLAPQELKFVLDYKYTLPVYEYYYSLASIAEAAYKELNTIDSMDAINMENLMFLYTNLISAWSLIDCLFTAIDVERRKDDNGSE